MKKKILSILLVLAMALSLVPLGAAAEENKFSTDALAPAKDKVMLLAEGDTASGDTAPAGTAEDPYIIPSGESTTRIQFDKPGYYRLAGDVTVDVIWGASKMGGAVTLDLAGHTITQKDAYGFVFVDDDLPELTIINSGSAKGYLKPTNDQASINIGGADNKLTIGKNVVVDASENLTARKETFSIAVQAEAKGSAEVVLDGCEINDANGFTVNGLSKANPKLTLKGARITANQTEQNAAPIAIYQAGPAESFDLNIENSEIKANGANGTGIEVRAGSLTLTNSTVTGGSGELTITPNGSGTTTTGAAIAVAQHTTKKPINVTLQGNTTLTAKTALSISNPQKNADTEPVAVTINGGTYHGAITVAKTGEYAISDNMTLNITGGTFDDDVSEYVEEGTYVCEQNGTGEDAKWVVSPYIAPKTVTFVLPTGVGLGAMTNLAAGTGDTKVYSVVDKAKAATFALTLPANTAADTVKVGTSTLTPDANGVYTIPAASLAADITVTVTVKTTLTDAAKLTVTVPSTESDVAEIAKLGKAIGDLQDGITVSGLKVTGTSKYVTGFTGFNNTDKTEQQGNYVALKLTSSEENGKIYVKSKNGNADGYKTLDTDGLLVFKLSVDEQSKAVKPIHVKLGDSLNAPEYDIDLSGITLGLPEMPAPGGSVTDGKIENDLSTGDAAAQVAEDIKNTIANASTGNADPSTSGDVDASKTEVTISFSGAAVNATNGGSVKLGSGAVAALQNQDSKNGVTVSTKVETNVADVVLPAGALAKLSGSNTVEVSVAKKGASDVNSNLPEAEKAAVGAAEAITNVTVKDGSTEMFQDASLTGSDAITIRIRVSNANQQYQILSVSTSSVKKAGAVQTPKTENGVSYIEIKVSDLSQSYAAVANTPENAALLAKLESAAQPGVLSLSYKSVEKLTSEERTKYYGGKLTINGLDANATYVVTFDYGGTLSGNYQVPRAVVVVQANAGGKVEVSCQSSMKVCVLKPIGGDLNADNIEALFFDTTPGVKNQGVLVTNSSRITQE